MICVLENEVETGIVSRVEYLTALNSTCSLHRSSYPVSHLAVQLYHRRARSPVFEQCGIAISSLSGCIYSLKS
jgi:hypothetical protein